MLTRYIGSFLICLLTFSFLTYRADSAIYKVIIYNDGEEVAQALGIWVAEGVLLTSSEILDWGDQFFIEDPDTGTRYLATFRSNSASMAFLSVPGLSIGSIAVLSAEPPESNSSVHVSFLDGVYQNGLLRFEETADSLFNHRYRFTMDVDSNAIGAPLMNRCEQLISIVSTQMGPDGVLVGISESYAALVSFLRADSVAFTIAPSPCPTIEEQLSEAQVLRAALQEGLDSLKGKLRSLEDSSAVSRDQNAERLAELTAQRSILEGRIADTEARQDSVRKESERLQVERDSLRGRIADTEARQDSVRKESERLQAERDSLRERNNMAQTQNRRQLLLLGGIAATLILIATILLFLFWKRRRDAEEELLDKDDELRKAEELIERKSVSFPDVVLHGLGPKNEEIRVKVSGEVLAQSERGVILGRSSKADCVIIESSVSRRHACMSLLNHTVMIHDMESLNGTVVDGVKLAPGEKRALSQGSQIVLGDVTLIMIIL